MITNGIGWVIGIAAIAVSVYLTIRGNQRKKLEIDSRVERLLLSQAGDQEGLNVTFNGLPIYEPQMVDVRIANVGKKDVASEHFDRAQPLILEMGSKVVARLESNEPGEGSVFDISDDARRLVIRPVKIAAGTNHQMRLLVDGRANMRVCGDHPLIDTDVIVDANSRFPETGLVARLNRANTRIIYSLLVAWIVYFALIADVEISMKRISVSLSDGNRWTNLLFYAMFVTAIFTAISQSYVGRKLKPIRSWVLGREG